MPNSEEGRNQNGRNVAAFSLLVQPIMSTLLYKEKNVFHRWERLDPLGAQERAGM